MPTIRTGAPVAPSTTPPANVPASPLSGVRATRTPAPAGELGDAPPLPRGPVPAGSSTAPRGPSSLLSAAANVARVATAATFFGGRWRLRPETLAARYGGMQDPSDFGQLRVSLPSGQRYVVRDNHFVLKNGMVGLNLIPVGDRKADGPGF